MQGFFLNTLKSYYRFIILCTLILCTIGFLTVQNLPISLYPSVSSPTIRAEVIFEESADTFYERWGRKMEESLRSIHGVKYVEATYGQTKVIYYMHFKWDTSSDVAKKEVKMVTSFYRARMPDYLPDVFVYYYDPGTENYLAIKHKYLKGHDLSRFIKVNLLPQIEAIPGVSRAWVSEPGAEFVHVKLDPFKLLKLGISVDDVVNLLQQHRFNFNLGRYKTDVGSEYNAQITLINHSAEDIRRIQVSNHHLQPIYLADIAEIDVEYNSYDRQFTLGDDEVIAVAMWPESGANLFKVSAAFLQSVEGYFGEDAEVMVLNHPNAFITSSINYLLYSIAAGMLSAALMVLLFYRHFSSMLLISITMPLSLGISFIVMEFLGIGINLISLSALGLTIGIVVDVAIIIMDNIIQPGTSDEDQGIDWYKTVAEKTLQVCPSILASMATSIVIFIPVAFTQPMTASILSDLVFSAVIILSVALLVCLFMVPSVAVLLGRRFFITKASSAKQVDGSSWLVKCYQQTWLMLLIVVSTFATSVLIIHHYIPQLPKEVIAAPKAEIIDVNLIFKQEGLQPDVKKSLIAPFRELIHQHLGENVRTIYTDFRRNNTYLSIHLNSYIAVDENLKTLNRILVETDDISVEIEPWVTSSLRVSAQPNLVLFFNHSNEDLNREIVAKASQYLKEQEGVIRVRLTPQQQKTSIIDIDVDEPTLNAISSEQFQENKDKLYSYIRYTIGPQDLYNLQMEGRGEMALKLSIAPPDQDNYLSIPMSLGQNLLFMNHMVTEYKNQVWREFFSRNGQKVNKLDIWLENSSNTAEATEAIIADLKLYLDSEFKLGIIPLSIDNNNDEMDENIASLVNALALAIVLTFLIVHFHYRQITLSCIVLSVVVFGIAGSTWALFYFDSTISLNSILGMLILTGLVVNNSILITDFYLILRQQGFTVHTAVSASLHKRSRALTITNLTTLAGMMPLAIGFGAGQDITKPLGISVAGGLVYATLLTIITLPAMLVLYGNVQEYIEEAHREPAKNEQTS